MEKVLPATLAVAKGNKEIYTEIKDSRNMKVYIMLLLLPKEQEKSEDSCPTSYI